MRKILMITVAALMTTLTLTACFSNRAIDREITNGVISQEEFDRLKESLDDFVADDRNDGYEHYIHKVTVDEESVNIQVDMRQNPLPHKNELIERSKSLVKFAATQLKDNIPITATITTTFKSEYTTYGIAKVNEAGEVSYERKSGMVLLE